MHERGVGTGRELLRQRRGVRRGKVRGDHAAPLRTMGVDRDDVVVSTKLFWGLKDSVNMRNTLNRKYLLSAMDASLQRFGLDYVDLVFCHRADPNTPIEETVWAMHDLIERGKALYWGTSEWTADELRAAFEIAERHHLRKPVMEQPEYNLLNRRRVEKEYARLYEDHGLGLTTWSPLASGALTGKYLDGVPEDSRASLDGYGWLRDSITSGRTQDVVRALAPIAEELDCTLAQLAIAWLAANPHVSTVITGASRESQVVENLAALDVIDRLTPELMARIHKISKR
ncbi:MAG: aldo/keto reductase [Ilumatobacteraceae bacterium]